MQEWKTDIPSLIPWRTNAAQAYLGMGDRDQARSLVEAQIAMLGDKPSRCLGISLRILAAICELDEREALLHWAIKLLGDAGALLELAHTMSDLGEVHHALGEEAKARVARRQAIRLAIVCGAEPLRRSIPADVVDTRRIGDDTGPAFQQPLVESLSTAERRVARLAALGYTNREIAGKLHLATGTVEQHLTRTYRKLRVDGRRALPGHFPGSVCRRPADALVLE
jgi:DNA-binding CsgD family transcriptional regulator